MASERLTTERVRALLELVLDGIAVDREWIVAELAAMRDYGGESADRMAEVRRKDKLIVDGSLAADILRRRLLPAQQRRSTPNPDQPLPGFEE